MLQEFKEIVGAYAYEVAKWLAGEDRFYVSYLDWRKSYDDMIEQRNQAIKAHNEVFRQREALKVQLKLLSSHSNMMLVVSENVDVFLNALTADIHRRNEHWWIDIKTGERLLATEYADYVVGTKIAKAHTELSEALDGFGKNLMDSHLPHRPMVEVELADVIVRVLDTAGAMNLDIGGALKEKLAYNANRADHKKESRLATGGKRI